MLELVRHFFCDKYIIGSLYHCGIKVCDTLEPPLLGLHPCISVGEYDIVLAYSPKFKKLMPRLLDVPKRVGILIHPGNSPKDTQGCILVGWNDVQGGLLNSKRAFNWLYSFIKCGSDCGDSTKLVIKNK